MAEQSKRLYRSSSNKVLAGVCGGIGEYLNVDPTVVRVAWILLSVLPLVPGIILYLIAWFIIPRRPEGVPSTPGAKSSLTATAFLGFFFIAVGSLILLGNLDFLDWDDWWEFSWEYVLPLLLIAIGVFFIARPAGLPGESAHGEKSRRPKATLPPAELRRSVVDRKIGGVCGGLGTYLGIDPSFLRIAFVFFTIWPFGLGAVVYLILLLVIPAEQTHTVQKA